MWGVLVEAAGPRRGRFADANAVAEGINHVGVVLELWLLLALRALCRRAENVLAVTLTERLDEGEGLGRYFDPLVPHAHVSAQRVEHVVVSARGGIRDHVAVAVAVLDVKTPLQWLETRAVDHALVDELHQISSRASIDESVGRCRGVGEDDDEATSDGEPPRERHEVDDERGELQDRDGDFERPCDVFGVKRKPPSKTVKVAAQTGVRGAAFGGVARRLGDDRACGDRADDGEHDQRADARARREDVKPTLSLFGDIGRDLHERVFVVKMSFRSMQKMHEASVHSNKREKVLEQADERRIVLESRPNKLNDAAERGDSAFSLVGSDRDNTERVEAP